MRKMQQLRSCNEDFDSVTSTEIEAIFAYLLEHLTGIDNGSRSSLESTFIVFVTLIGITRNLEGGFFLSGERSIAVSLVLLIVDPIVQWSCSSVPLTA
jgi:uncharacterized transporter YbjL